MRDSLFPGSSAGTWFSRRAWCCRPSGYPAHSAGPAWSAAGSDSPAGGEEAQANERGQQSREAKTGRLRRLFTRVWETHSFQLLVTGAEPLPLAGDDGEQGVHLTLRKLRVETHAWTCWQHTEELLHATTQVKTSKTSRHTLSDYPEWKWKQRRLIAAFTSKGKFFELTVEMKRKTFNKTMHLFIKCILPF